MQDRLLSSGLTSRVQSGSITLPVIASPEISSFSWLSPHPRRSAIEMQQEDEPFEKAPLELVQSRCLQTQAGLEASCRDRSFALAYGVKSD